MKNSFIMLGVVFFLLLTLVLFVEFALYSFQGHVIGNIEVNITGITDIKY